MAKKTAKDPAAVKLGHKGGLKGGPKRDKVLSATEKKSIARQGGKAKARKYAK